MSQRKDRAGHATEQNPLGRDWKKTWAERAEDPDERRRTRREKREARRRVHKSVRRATKTQLERELPE